MTPELPENQIEYEVRPRDLLIFSLALLPLVIAFTTGPKWSAHGLILSRLVGQRPLAAWPEAWLMAGVEKSGNIGAAIFLIVQALVMGVCVIVVAIAASRIFVGKNNVGMICGLFMAVSIEWQRRSGSISPDAISGGFGLMGFCAWLYLRKPEYHFSSTYYLIPAFFLILASLFSGFWLLIAIPVFFDLAIMMADENMKESHLKFMSFLTFIIAILTLFLFLSTAAERVMIQYESRLENGQIMTGYPDFRISGKMPQTLQDNDGFFTKYSQILKDVKVGGIRVVCEVAGIRSFFSIWHNCLIMLIHWPILLLATASILLNLRNPAFFPFQLIIFIWFFFTARVGSDWDGRHLNQIWPILVLLAGGFQCRFQLRPSIYRMSIFLMPILFAGLLAHSWLLTAAARYLTVDRREASDVMVVLVGGDPDRDALVARMYHDGYAPEIWLADESRVPVTDPGSDAGSLIQRLVRSGVPRERIRLLPPARNTIEEGERVAEYIDQMKVGERPRSITVVTTGFHSRRALFIFERKLSGLPIRVSIAASDDQLLGPEKWWLDKHKRSVYMQEFAKLFFTWWLID
jgi:uncharacterized SAM-binding protein YcdF (DUF218 family)